MMELFQQKSLKTKRNNYWIYNIKIPFFGGEMILSWEEINRGTYPCRCGKGTYTIISKMDDWNRTKHSTILNCPECAEQEKLKSIKEAEERELLEKLDNEIKKSFEEKYKDKWIMYFENAKNKKQIWEMARRLGIEENSLSTFYSRNRNINMSDYIMSLANYQHMDKIMSYININDNNLKSKSDTAMKLYKADLSRRINDWYNNN